MNKMRREYYITSARTLTAREAGSTTMMILRNGVFTGFAYLR